MGFFSKILEKLGIGSAAAAPAPAPPPTAAPASPGRGAGCTAAAQAGRTGRCRRATGAARGGEPAEAELADLHRRPAETPRDRQQLRGAQGAGHGAGLPGGADGGFGEDEHVAAQDRARAHRRQRRQCARRPSGLNRQQDYHQPKGAGIGPGGGARVVRWARMTAFRNGLGLATAPRSGCRTEASWRNLPMRHKNGGGFGAPAVDGEP